MCKSSIQLQLLGVPQGKQTSDDWYTPPWLFALLGITFDLDVAGAEKPLPWIPAKNTFTQQEDGLTKDWYGNVWMNPPYSNPLPWILRFVEHGNGIALVPTSTGKWFLHMWESNAKLVAMPNVKFWTLKGEAKANMPIRCWLAAFGENNIDAIGKVGKVR